MYVYVYTTCLDQEILHASTCTVYKPNMLAPEERKTSNLFRGIFRQAPNIDDWLFSSCHKSEHLWVSERCLSGLKHSQIVALRSGCLEGSGSNWSWGGMRGIALRWIGLILAALTYVMMLITPGTGYTIGDPGATTAYAKPLIVPGGSQNTSASSQRNITRCGPRFCHRVDTGNPTLKP